MDQTTQIVFNIIVGVAGAICMFVLYAVWSKLGELERSDKELANEIGKMHVLVAGEYVKRAEIAPQLSDIFDELKAIRHDLSRKVERRADQ